MKVAKLVETRRMEVIDEPIPELFLGRVLVRVRAAGICGSDVHYFTHGGLGSQKSTMPMSLGHEAAGEVVETGERVAIDPALPCGECAACLAGRWNLCYRGTFSGSNGNGFMREYVAVNPTQLVPLPDGMPYELGAMIEPLAVALHAVRLSHVRDDARVAIFGAGPIGLCIAMLCGRAATLQFIDPLYYRLEQGMDVFGGRRGFLDANACIQADVVFDAAGTQNSLNGCMQVAAPGGKVIIVGIPTVDTLCYNPHLCRTKELTIISTRRCNNEMGNALARSADLPLEKLVTHRFEVDSVQEAFETAAGYRDGILKGVVVFGGANG